MITAILSFPTMEPVRTTPLHADVQWMRLSTVQSVSPVWTQTVICSPSAVFQKQRSRFRTSL